MKIMDLYDIEKTIAKELFNDVTYPWECLPKIHNFILELGKKLDKEKFNQIGDDIWISKSSIIDKSAQIIGPAIIDENAEIRHNAFIRGNVIIGKKCVIGNSTELKNSVLFDETQVPHFNYVGDSILGYKSHFGAGVIASNLRSDKKKIIIDKIDTNLNKVGAFVGDGVEVGCNSVLNPGTVVGKNTIIFPLSCARGLIKENSLYKR